MMKPPAATARTNRGTIVEDGSYPTRVRGVKQVWEDLSDAIHVLYERHAPRVRAYLKRMVGEPDREDLTQQIFVKLLTAIGRYEPRQHVPFVAWPLERTPQRSVTV
jgi:DNA-directed RNA polymerase specialized sigma subunit